MNRKGLFVILLILSVGLLTACSATSAQEINAKGTAAAALTIDASTLSSEPTFVDWVQNGTAMQLIARKDETGAVRLAFNTCQSCGGSPYAWFEYLGGNTLQCQNCGLTFALDTVGTTKAAGCNPVTITEFTVDGDTVTVPESVLAANVERFVNWKKIAQ